MTPRDRAGVEGCVCVCVVRSGGRGRRDKQGGAELVNDAGKRARQEGSNENREPKVTGPINGKSGRQREDRHSNRKRGIKEEAGAGPKSM